MANDVSILIKADMSSAEKSVKSFQKQVSKTKVNFKSDSIKGIKTGFDNATSSVKGLGSELVHSGKKFAEFYIIGNVIVNIGRSLSDLREIVFDLNRDLTLMSFTSEFTNEQFWQMIGLTSELAEDLGSTNAQVLEATKLYTNLNSSLEEIVNNSEAAVVLSNLGGDSVSIAESASAIQGLSEQFGKTSDDALELVDTLTFVSSSLKMDFAQGLKELSSSVSIAGALAKESGIEYELYLSIVGKVAESTRRSGSAIASGKFLAHSH